MSLTSWKAADLDRSLVFKSDPQFGDRHVETTLDNSSVTVKITPVRFGYNVGYVPFWERSCSIAFHTVFISAPRLVPEPFFPLQSALVRIKDLNSMALCA